ncbi:MAG: aminotransferase class I/II-fold pyridoxal phosphate-dependent enzyme [Clostridia bacterium]|nr:aminotransferase class I/II-fold pyridoxal phosphate-dependent enzyme [Clostridia bacterium]
MLKMPLIEEISEYLKHSFLGFHTPGHQQGQGSESCFQQLLQQGLLQLDLTEVPGLDNLHHPCGCLYESQRLAADLFGARETFYLVNGSTVGLQAALLAINRPQGKVIIPRHAHISVLNGLILSGGVPLISPVQMEKKWGIPLGLSAEKLSSLLEEEAPDEVSEGETSEKVVSAEKAPVAKMPEIAKISGKQERVAQVAGKTDIDLVFTVNPTYQGVGYSAGVINKLIKEKGLCHLVDEAHGGHLFFQSELPLSLQKEGADIVIQSTHKTLSALTQASMLHVNTEKFRAPVREALNILQTTSPSYLLMASLDSVQAQLRTEGAALVGKSLETAFLLRKTIEEIPGFRVFPDEPLPVGWYHDPTKVLVSAAELGLTGWELAELLREKYGIVVEMFDYYAVLFLVTWGHSSADISRVGIALRQIGRENRKKALDSLPLPVSFYEESVRLLLTPREVYYNKKEVVKIDEAVGRICGRALTIYPPGIPCLWPGQVIEPEHLEYVRWALREKLRVQGVSAEEKITVLKV